jgi:diguanylate cyclase (GGDEF)-like protein/PAS domain S-box-containing protein
MRRLYNPWPETASATDTPGEPAYGGRGMGKPVKVLVVGDAHADALKVASDLDRGGYQPAVFLASTEAEIERIAPTCELVLAWAGATVVPPFRLLVLAAQRGDFPPVVVLADRFSDEEIVGYVRAGACDCVRRGDHARLNAAVERERQREPRRPEARDTADAGDTYRALIEEIPALTYVAWADESGSRAYVSPQLQAMVGFSPGEWLAEPDMWVRRLHPEDRERVLREFREACASGGRFASEYRILDREGRVVWWNDAGTVLPGPDGKARFVRGFVLDVTERKLAEESVRRLRQHDQVTGLPNRAMLQNRLGPALAESVRTGRPLALLILALDRFREVKNTLGHHHGDTIVRDLAARIGDALGDPERVARLKGDEFGVLLPDADAAFARQVADRIQRTLERPFMVQKLPVEISSSIGIAVCPRHGTEAETLLRHADAALVAAQKLGGGECVVYSNACEPHDPERLALLAELRRALEANELHLAFQPKVDLKTRTLTGAEALLRWNHPRRGYVPPDDFVRLAETTALIRSLTRWVLDRAVGEARAWERAGRQIPVAVNVSARSLHDSRIVEDVEEALVTHDLRAERLVVEVTESAVMVSDAHAETVLKELADRRVVVAIDDFGMGYTSFDHLRQLPVQELKIDKSFVIGMAKEDGGGGNGRNTPFEDTAIVRSAADLAHNLGLGVVAEGVEDQWTLDLLSSFGCDQAQGYYIARPMPAAAFAGWVGGSPWRVLAT